MSTEYPLDENLLHRLPLPLARLYRRAHNANGAQNRHQAAYFLWEAALKLLGSVAVVEYAAHGPADPQVAERLKNLARPAIGHWWEFVRLLVPALADGGDPAFAQARDLLLGRARDDLPRQAGLDAALREALEGTQGARSTVRLSELFDHLVRYRNRELGHGAMGLRAAEFYERLGRSLLAGVTELLGRLDVLVGRRLIYVGEVRQVGGVWVGQRFELIGEGARALAPLELPRDQAARLPDADRVYLDGPGEGATAAPRLLHPLLVYDHEAGEVYYLNARRGQQRTEYLSYTTGRVIERKDLAGEQQSLLARLMGAPVDEKQVSQWGARAAGEEEQAAPAQPETAGQTPRRIGEFEVFSELGRGGMGVVYRAWQPSLGRQVALKKLLRSGEAGTEARFLREIRALGRVEHPNLVKVFTSGSEGEDWYYAMELVEGADLAGVTDRLSRGAAAATLGDAEWRQAVTTACADARQKEKPLSEDGRHPPAPAHAPAHAPAPAAEPAAGRGLEYIRRAAEIIRQAASAAHALHAAGVVHRDIKPGNILLTPDGSHAVLMDLGLAQLADEMEGRLTRTREFVGTLRYASPEQILAVTAVDCRSDIYSLGATLWELLTLRPMYNAGPQTAAPELMQRIQYEEPESVRRYNPRVPRDLDAIVLKCLEKDPGRRYQTARELTDDLHRFLAGEPVHARPIGPVRRLVRRARRHKGAAALVLLATILLAGLAFKSYQWWLGREEQQEVDTYYSQIAWRWRAVEGVGRVRRQEAGQRNLAWKITTRNKLVEKVEAVNGSGAPIENGFGALISRWNAPGRECSVEYRRRDDGKTLDLEIARDRADQIVWTFHYSTPSTGFFADDRGIPLARGGTGAAFVQFDFNDAGFTSETHYLDKNGKPQSSAMGAFRVQQTYDANGLCLEWRYLDVDGQLAPTKAGYARMTAAYDNQYNLVDQAYFDKNGQPTRSNFGYARVKMTFDGHGNGTEYDYFDEADKPVRSTNGYARLTALYDAHGNRSAEAYFNEAGQPARGTNGYAQVRWSYNDHGDWTDQAYLNEAGQPTRSINGYARVTAAYDDRRNGIDFAYFDESNQPIKNTSGFARMTCAYDGHANRTDEKYFDETGQPTRSTSGYAEARLTFDDHGNRTAVAYFDETGQPIKSTSGFASLTAKFDEGGNWIEEDYFDEASHPVRTKTGCAQTRAKYDDRGNLIEESTYDEAGQPINNANGYARVEVQYDERDQPSQRTYYDAAGGMLVPRAVIQTVSPASPAEQLGLKPGDVILTYDGKDVPSYATFTSERRLAPSDTGVKDLVVLRDGKRLTFHLPPGLLGITLEDQFQPAAAVGEPKG